MEQRIEQRCGNCDYFSASILGNYHGTCYIDGKSLRVDEYSLPLTVNNNGETCFEKPSYHPTDWARLFRLGRMIPEILGEIKHWINK